MLQGGNYDELKKNRRDLWRRLKAAAAIRGITIRKWLEEAIVEKLEREGWGEEQLRSRGSQRNS